MEERGCDVLIVGAGGAALRAAIAAYDVDPQARVLVVTKGELGQSGVTATACSDRMAFHATLDTTEPKEPHAWRYHAKDIYRIGGHVSDGDLAEILARNAQAAFADLDRWGVPFVRKADGTVDQFVTDGSEYARACYTGPYTANHIERALVAQIQEREIEILPYHMIAELLPAAQGDRVAGAVAIDQRTDALTLIRAKAVVLATGGAGQAFAMNVFPAGMTGDGFALAYRLGAELVNLEFIQIGLSSVKTKLACSGSMMRALPRLVNDDGKEFLADYFPEDTAYAHIYGVLFAKGASWPVSWREPSHIIDIAVYYERAKGHHVYLDYRADPVGYDPTALSPLIRDWYHEQKGVDLDDADQAGSPLRRLLGINPEVVEWLAERGVDLAAGDKIALAPAIQHFQGGVKIRQRGDTTVSGLYAAGETAGGQHGANRPGGNALLDSQVFGKIAGVSAAQEAAETSQWPAIDEDRQGTALDEIKAWVQGDGAPTATSVRAKCQAILSDVASVVRTAARLEQGLCELETLIQHGLSADQAGLAYAMETRNILLVGRLIVTAAETRQESRGPHLMFAAYGDLEPLPRDDETWQRYIVLSQGPDDIEVRLKEPTPMADALTA